MTGIKTNVNNKHGNITSCLEGIRITENLRSVERVLNNHVHDINCVIFSESLKRDVEPYHMGFFLSLPTKVS